MANLIFQIRRPLTRWQDKYFFHSQTLYSRFSSGVEKVLSINASNVGATSKVHHILNDMREAIVDLNLFPVTFVFEDFLRKDT